MKKQAPSSAIAPSPAHRSRIRDPQVRDMGRRVILRADASLA
jgi:hypothetical protein